MTGPYLVTLTPACTCDCCPGDTRTCCDSLLRSRVAVETLDEDGLDAIQDAIDLSEIADDEWARLCRAALDLPFEGGSLTVSDGSTITVEQVTWEELCRVAGISEHYAQLAQERSVVVAGNASRTILAHAAFNESEEAARA